jgi:radical SAM superfamily enzyme YgiQ (UPF0313 family)
VSRYDLINKIDQLLDAEEGTIYKDPGGKLNICLIYPNVYFIGMSNLGFQSIYGMLNQRGDVVCERAFLPEKDALAEFARTGARIFSFESKRALCEFDILAFSVSFENDYPNIVSILRLAHVPPRACHRNEKYPLVVMGGACAFFNPEPVADFFDAIFIGEAEDMIEEFVLTCQKNLTKTERLTALSAYAGFYIPSSTDANALARQSQTSHKIQKRQVKTLRDIPLQSVIITPNAEFSSMRLIEAQRGCPRQCRFCVASFAYRPSRNQDIQTLKKLITQMGHKKIGLVGPSLSDMPGIEEILQLNDVHFSLTSLRANSKSKGLLPYFKNRKSLSIAPEAGSRRLREAIRKGVTEADILDIALASLEIVSTLRLYFMIGLPGETMEDIQEIVSLVDNIKQKQKKGVIALSVSSFVPKPWTPFQWMAMDSPENLHRKLLALKKSLASVKGVALRHESPTESEMQGFFSRGDRSASKVVESLADGVKWGAIKKTFPFEHNDSIPFERPLPWDFIDSGVEKDYLIQECMKTLALI